MSIREVSRRITALITTTLQAASKKINWRRAGDNSNEFTTWTLIGEVLFPIQLLVIILDVTFPGIGKHFNRDRFTTWLDDTFKEMMIARAIKALDKDKHLKDK